MRKLKTNEKVVLGAILVILAVLAIINLCVLKNDGFFETSLSTCVSIIVVLIVSYWLTNINQDERNQKEIYLKLLEKIIILANDSAMYKIDEKSDIYMILMKKRELNNTVSLLNEYSKKFNVESDIYFINEKVQEYANLIGNHQDDLEFLTKCEIDLKRPLELIENRAYSAMMKVFE